MRKKVYLRIHEITKKRIWLVCNWCKELFAKRPSDIIQGKGKFCTRSCYLEAVHNYNLEEGLIKENRQIKQDVIKAEQLYKHMNNHFPQ